MIGEEKTLSRVLKALTFASEKHRSQRRKDVEASPYINHPISLANVLANEAGIVDEDVIVAAILHDTVEDTATTFEEVEREFGATVRALVVEVTDNKTLSKAERKRLQVEHASRASFRAQQIKLADKITNLRDMILHPPAGWDLRRKREYFDWAKQVIDGLRGSHEALERLFDEAYREKP